MVGWPFKMNKLYLSILMVTFGILIMLSSVDAATLGDGYGLNKCVALKQTCSNCTYVNITSVSAVTNDGSSVKLLGSVAMQKQGTEYNYTFCSTGYVGEYTYITVGNPDGIVDTESVTFQVGNSSIILIIVIFLLIYAIAFFGFFGKHIWVSVLGGLGLLALGLFTFMNGIDIYRNFITNTVAIITFALGAIFALVAIIELIGETYE
jgi:hypothetical protein